MKILLTLSLLFLSACADISAPTPPEIKTHYMLDVSPMAWPQATVNTIINADDIRKSDKDIVRCMKFDVVTLVPYKIKFVSEVSIQECHLMGGPKPKELKAILEWVTAVIDWAESKKHCLKQ